MPKRHMYGLKIINDEDEGFEYSPPFKLRVFGSMFRKGSALEGEVNYTQPAPPSNSEKGVEWRS